MFYFLFGALDTYNTVTVVIFIVSHYWFLIAVKKKNKIKKNIENVFVYMLLIHCLNFMFVSTTYKGLNYMFSYTLTMK